MRHLFPGHYRPSDDTLSKMWSEGIIVPDTNVLLDLYRYPASTCVEVLQVLESISERLWIPHQVALEYQWNRTIVLAEQEAEYSKVTSMLDNLVTKLKNELGNKRHSLIDCAQIVNAFSEAKDKCVKALNEAEEKQLGSTGEDQIRAKLDRLLEGRIGTPPNQSRLAELYKEGELRFARSEPPGFLDRQKKKPQKASKAVAGVAQELTSAESESEVEVEMDLAHLHNGLQHKRKFGDWIAWAQLLDYVKEKGIRHVIWITSESGRDWWHLAGKKKLGPRPELTEELRRNGAEAFHMYDLERFLRYAKESINAGISSQTLMAVQEVSEARQGVASVHLPGVGSQSIVMAVLRWLETRNPGDSIRANGHSGLVIRHSMNRRTYVRIFNFTVSVAVSDIRATLRESKLGPPNALWIYVFVCTSFDHAMWVYSKLQSLGDANVRPGSEYNIGYISETGEYVTVASLVLQ